MDKFLKNKTIVILIVVVVVLIGAAVFFIGSRSQSQDDNFADQTQNIKKIKAEDIGLILTPRKDGKAITMKITKLDGIKTIEYDVSYDAIVTEEGETATVPRGVIGSPIEVKPGQEEVSRDLDLGTCSRNVCKYDNVVSDVKFVIKVTYTNGEIASVEESISVK